MGKYFGTDGVRGVANKELTPELAFKLGRIGAYLLLRDSSSSCEPKIVVGRDTRKSGEMLESALTSGILSVGVDVVRLGVIPTPAVAFMTKALHASGGVMISASHNPFEDNGIKFFGGDGFKLLDELEDEFERLIDSDDHLPRPTGDKIGSMIDYLEGSQKYIRFLKTTINHTFDDLKIVIDCANGAASSIAVKLFADLGATIIPLSCNPNGLNINVNCGSTHPETLQKIVVEKKADLGLAFDGDADRLIAVDENGNIIDGDDILFICGKYLKKHNELKHNTVVSTIMCNYGFKKAMDKEEISLKQTSVGDRYVMEEMIKGGYNIGGEQSGHIIFLNHNTTGDGLLTAIQLVNVMVDEKKSISELSKGFVKYPQLLKNVKVKDKNTWKENPIVQQAIQEGENVLGENGRILVRPSGTEPIIRVMAEGPDESTISSIVEKIADAIELNC